MNMRNGDCVVLFISWEETVPKICLYCSGCSLY
jgi:hypothetical protein